LNHWSKVVCVRKGSTSDATRLGFIHIVCATNYPPEFWELFVRPTYIIHVFQHICYAWKHCLKLFSETFFFTEYYNFLLAGRILRKIGHVHAMSLVLFAFGLRFLIYSFLENPWWCLPVELFQGFTFGLFYATMASYASIVALPGTEATVQGTVGAVFEGIGKYICGYCVSVFCPQVEVPRINLTSSSRC
jgi:hypothetical protein